MKPIFIALFAGWAFTSCAPSTPQTRIEKNPQAFARLSPKQQDLVRQGQLAPGMSPEAVVLAWGNAEQRYEGSRNGRPAERWDYVGSRPVYSADLFTGYGPYGYGPYGYGPYSHYGYGIGPDVAFVPYRIGSVWFTGGKVESWERVRQ
ncbi:hypothetical protein JIN84_22805 [Luteolibacter yonseiensis]|uniref:Lipoprotein n=1 Tax=Luteolibacter yonseiensis TaxID=1144680 RepID=A0A934V9L5_9BACT|nr:hypothetical protein [Luteolibacter yonseiensis]MBK1818467.1 hypothetical protein [Luteolibacter yonseiensis]